MTKYYFQVCSGGVDIYLFGPLHTIDDRDKEAKLYWKHECSQGYDSIHWLDIDFETGHVKCGSFMNEDMEDDVDEVTGN